MNATANISSIFADVIDSHLIYAKVEQDVLAEFGYPKNLLSEVIEFADPVFKKGVVSGRLATIYEQVGKGEE